MEAHIGKIDDAHTISELGREDDLAVGSRSCISELAIDAQMHGNVVEMEALIGEDDCCICCNLRKTLMARTVPTNTAVTLKEVVRVSSPLSIVLSLGNWPSG